MRRLNIVFIVLTFLLGSACSNKKKSNKSPKPDTLEYIYHNIKEQTRNCPGTASSGCIIATITYPVFTKKTLLLDSIQKHLLELDIYGYIPSKNLSEQAKNFIKYYESLTNHSLESKSGFALKSSAKILTQDSSLTTIKISEYRNSSGPYPISLLLFINWNTKEDKLITLSDIFIDNYKFPLNTIAEKVFRKQEMLKDTSSLKNKYTFKDNRFSVNNNFLITSQGILFIFNQFEIKLDDQINGNIFIPYQSIKHLLRPNTVISQYIK